MPDKKKEAFKSLPIEEVRGNALGDEAFRRNVLREAQRWAEHVGHYNTVEHLHSYLKLLNNHNSGEL